MIRRAILVAAAAALLIFAPSAAMAAYQAPGFTSTVSDSSPAVGQCVTVTIDGGAANAGQVISLTATGPSTKSYTATANANGVATFSVCLSVAGDYTLIARNSAGAIVDDTLTLTVHAVSAAGVVPTPDQLSFTGANALPLAAGGGLLVLAGAGAVLVARRRKSAQVAA